jgi:hypothetical protein
MLKIQALSILQQHQAAYMCGVELTEYYGPVYVCDLLPLADVLFIPRMIYVWRATMEWYIDREKPKNSEKNLSQCHLVHHKSHMD